MTYTRSRNAHRHMPGTFPYFLARLSARHTLD